MPTAKKPMQTIRHKGTQQDNKKSDWYIYTSTKVRDELEEIPREVNQTIVAALESKIKTNETYVKYKKRELKDKQAGFQGKKMSVQHDVGFYRSQMSAVIMLIVGIIGLFSGALNLINNTINKGVELDNIYRNDTTPATAASEKLISAPSTIGFSIANLVIMSFSMFFLFVGGILSCCMIRSQDIAKREKKLFDNLEDLMARLPEIDAEIKLKEKVIEKLIKFIEMDHALYGQKKQPFVAQARLIVEEIQYENESSTVNNMPTDRPYILPDRDNFFDDLAIAFDSSGDLDLYETVGKNLSTNSYVKENKNLLSKTLLMLSLGVFYNKFYEDNRNYFDTDKFQFASIFEFIKKIKDKPLSKYSGKLTQEQFVLKVLIEQLSDNYRLILAKKLYLLVTQIDFKVNQYETAGQIVKLLSNDRDYKVLNENFDKFLENKNLKDNKEQKSLLEVLTGEKQLRDIKAVGELLDTLTSADALFMIQYNKLSM